MTSSSSSSHCVPTSITQSWNYDVFLSFRGEDTRKSFVDHLYTALVQKGIHTYKDDETLARGESIGPSLMKAIQESRIAVIVFSKNYANSSWCLDELAYIIECMDTQGQIVMPIFYDVDPSDVRKQKGKYGEAFAKHEKRHKIKSWRKKIGKYAKHECDKKQKIESWREALVKAGNLSGWVPKDFANGHEAKCIEDIVGTISNNVSQLITNVNKDFIGMEARLQDLKSKLEIGSGGVRIVGIWGVGGGGKTTLAFAAHMEISHQFEAQCFLENIREESSKHGLRSLQEKILSLVLKRNVVVGSEIEGRSMLKRRLCHKSVLVVLDDVDDLKQLEALAGSHDWFGEGSRIIITTRDEHLLTRHADTICEVSLLSHDEAIKLFSKHAYRKDKPVEDYENLSHHVVSYAGGLPLALEVLGSFLYDKDKDEWRSVLAKLKCIPDAKVTERLKISYDGLEPHEKELFLDIACVMKGRFIDKAMMVLDGCGFHPADIGLKVLVQKSLVKVSNGTFEMHDLLEEMAHYIVSGAHPNHPEKYSRIWKDEDFEKLCAMEAGTLMENEAFYSSFDSCSLRPRLPDVIANMKKLRWLYWEYYPASSFLSNSWSSSFLSNSRSKALPNLKFLDLSNSKFLMRTPDFNCLPCLERLNLKRCEQLIVIDPSIGYHEKLVCVNMSECREIQTFPTIKGMPKLETLNLSHCRQLQNFPHILRNMDSLVNLHWDYTDIEIIPASVGRFCTNLVSFDLSHCKKLKRIEGDFRLLERLKHLHLLGCYQLEKLPKDFFYEECCLEVLSLSGTKSPDSSRSLIMSLMEDLIGLQIPQQDSTFEMVIPKLPQFPRFLKKLVLSGCHLGDGDIPCDISDQLLNLQVLDLSGNDFTRLHSILSRIPCLKFLSLSDCERLLELPDLPLSIAILEAKKCSMLQRIGDLSYYRWLWKVILSSRVRYLVDDERVLQSMLQVNAIEDRFMSFIFGPEPQVLHYNYMKFMNDREHSYFFGYPVQGNYWRPPAIPKELSDSPVRETTITLQLPHNWHSDFSGFLLCGNKLVSSFAIDIEKELSIDSQPDNDYWAEFDKRTEPSEYAWVGYVPFASLRHTSWWNPTYTNYISVKIHNMVNPKVALVPRNSKSGDSRERPIDCLECWEEEGGPYRKTFEIKDSTESSSIRIQWTHY